jgi:diadenosine tetraphosphate (Ap4A) HIT family hydrolase
MNSMNVKIFCCLFQDDGYVAFPDIRPAAKHHYLIVTREHIRGVKELTAEHKFVGKCRLVSGEINCKSQRSFWNNSV